ncbi:hypothetical protein WJX79_007700 [Trebouxia sp. C0005]
MTGYGEWHRFYCRFRELCGQRQCQPDAEHYDALWLRFLTDSGIVAENEQGLDNLPSCSANSNKRTQQERVDNIDLIAWTKLATKKVGMLTIIESMNGGFNSCGDRFLNSTRLQLRAQANLQVVATGL